MRLLKTEFSECLAQEKKKRRAGRLLRKRKKTPERRKLTLATGKLAAPLLTELAAEFMEIHPDREICVTAVENHFFGERITVSGLLTGADLKAQLSAYDLGERLLIPCNMLRSGEEVFLDDVTLTELAGTLQVPVHVVKSDGKSLLEAFLL